MSAPQIIAGAVMAVGSIGYAAVATLAGRTVTVRGRSVTLPEVIVLPLRTHAIVQVIGVAGWATLLGWGGFWS